MRGQFLLNLGAVIAGSAIEFLLRILQFVGIEAELGLGNLKVVAVLSRLSRHPSLSGLEPDAAVRLIDQRLVFLDELLKLFDPLRERKRIAREVAMLCLRVGLAQRRSKGLVHFVIGQTFGLVRVLGLLGGYGQWRQGLGCLPGTQIDKGLLALPKAADVTLS